MRKILTNPTDLLRVLVVILVSLLMSFGNNTYAATTLKDCVRVDISSNNPRTPECATLMNAASSDQIQALVDEIMLSQNNENTRAGGATNPNPGGGPVPGGATNPNPSNTQGDLSYSLKNPLAFDSIQSFVVAVLNVIIVIATPIVVIFIILAGFKYVTARGNATQVQEATRALTYAIIGGVLIIGAVAIAEIIKDLVTSFS